MFLFRFFGLVLIDLDMREIKSQRIINLIWMCGSMGICVYIMLGTNVLMQNFKTMSEIIEVGNYIFIVLTHFVILLHSQSTVGANIHWYQKLNYASETLRDKCDIVVQNSAHYWKNLVKIGFCLGLCLLFSLINIYYSLDYRNSVLFTTIHYHFIKFILNVRYMEYAIRLDIFKQHIKAYKKALRRIIENNKIKWKIKLSRHDDIQLVYDQNKIIDNPKQILTLKQILSWMYDSTKLLECCYGWSLILMVSFTFMDLTSNLYWFFLAFLKIDDKFDAFDCVFEILGSVIALSCLIFSSYDASIESVEGMNLALRLLSSKSSSTVYNTITKEYLMQIYHEKIENSGNDFFMVDFKLLFGVSIRVRMISNVKANATKIFCGIYVYISNHSHAVKDPKKYLT